MNNLPSDLAEYFSDYRAEWSASLFGDLFVAPPYFQKLESKRPCVLIGGRGTGKTTSLRSLRFDATAERLRSDNLDPATMPYFGIYVRINKNRVRAFQGGALTSDDWNRAFAHYFNVLASIELCRLLEWLYGIQQRRVDLTPVSESLCIPPARDCDTLLAGLNQALTRLEVWINNPAQAERPLLSIAEAPLRIFVETLQTQGALGDRVVFCCIDEYENLLDYQQSILNTYLKHSSPPLSYKIGTKRRGLRSRATIDTTDIISAPEDYQEIDISSDGFEDFARQVLEHRLDLAASRGACATRDADEFLPELPLEIEARLLGCERIAAVVRQAIEDADDVTLNTWAAERPSSELYFLKYWAEGDSADVVSLARDWMCNEDAWATRFGNYGYASLFWLSRGRKGSTIRKYYAGLRTFLLLASGNIRYFIELIDEALASTSAESDANWRGAITPQHQTLAARAVGRRRLDQLESLTEHGPHIKRLVLGIGKVFFELARDPVGRAPEQNAFVLSGTPQALEEVTKLLYEGVAHLAFEAAPRTKATTQAEMRDDEFRIHPIYSAFFEYSHRKKRRVTFSADTLLELLTSPRSAISQLLASRQQTPLPELPNQLALFSSFYER